jgi:hypothetical protein
MTNDTLPTNPLIEKLISLTDDFCDKYSLLGPNPYEAVQDLLEELKTGGVYFKQGLGGEYLSLIYDTIEKDTEFESSPRNVGILVLEQLLDDMDDLEENCNE